MRDGPVCVPHGRVDPEVVRLDVGALLEVAVDRRARDVGVLDPRGQRVVELLDVRRDLLVGREAEQELEVLDVLDSEPGKNA